MKPFSKTKKEAFLKKLLKMKTQIESIDAEVADIPHSIMGFTNKSLSISFRNNIWKAKQILNEAYIELLTTI